MYELCVDWYEVGSESQYCLVKDARKDSRYISAFLVLYPKGKGFECKKNLGQKYFDPFCHDSATFFLFVCGDTGAAIQAGQRTQGIGR